MKVLVKVLSSSLLKLIAVAYYYVVVVVVVQQIVVVKVVVDGFTTTNSIYCSTSSSSSSQQWIIIPPLKTTTTTTTRTALQSLFSTTAETKQAISSSSSNGSIMSTVILNDDIRNELISQKSNEDNAKLYDFYSNCGDDDDGILLQPNQVMDTTRRNIIHHKHYDTYSFDDLFPNIDFSKTFNSCTEFRNELRNAIRCDMIFDVNADDNNNDNGRPTPTTNTPARNITQPPIYNYMTDKQRYDELSKNKPLIGYWRKQQQQNQKNKNKNKNDNTNTNTNNDNDNEKTTACLSPTSTTIRFTEITKVLNQYLVGSSENNAVVPTGDEFINAIGLLCNSTSTSTSISTANENDNDNDTPYHWTDVVGVAATQNNKMGDKTKHAWHQDYGHLQPQQSPPNSQNGQNDNDNDNDTTDTITNKKKKQYLNNKHVFLGFPYENNYHGTGVLPHIIKSKYEQWSTVEKSIFYTATSTSTTTSASNNGDNSNDDNDGVSDSDDGEKSADTEEEEQLQLQEQLEEYIIRPKYIPGEIEIIVFRDIDVLHSSPDIQYRSSIMRFG